MDFEDGQVIGRSLDHDRLARRMDPLARTCGTFLAAKDGFDLLDMQSRTSQVNDSIEHLLHLSATLKEQVTAVLGLVNRVALSKAALASFFCRQSKMETGGVNPTLANLTQLPYNVRRTQGLCKLRQFC